jgi:hypothetical protein
MRTILPLVVVCVFAGCSPVRSVRAVRQHGREPASAAAVVARAEDLRESLALLDRLLAGPGYGGPGTLAKQLALGETEADGLIKELESTGIYRNAALRVPVVTLYRRHLDEVLTQAAGGSSLLAAVEARFGADSGLVAAWQGLTRARAALAEGRRAWARLDEQRDALAADDKAGRERLAQAMEAQDQENDRVASTIEASRTAVTSAFGTLKFDLTDAEARALMDDLIAALSFGGRMAAEGAALVQVVLSQTYGALRDFKKRPGQAAEDLLTVVLTLRSLDGDLAIATEVLSDLASSPPRWPTSISTKPLDISTKTPRRISSGGWPSTASTSTCGPVARCSSSTTPSATGRPRRVRSPTSPTTSPASASGWSTRSNPLFCDGFPEPGP